PYQTYQPETLKDVEIGIKSDFFLGDMPVRFNLAAYRGEYDNVAVSFDSSAGVAAADPGSPLSSSVGINSVQRIHQGFETELVLQPTDSLNISANAAFFDLVIKEGGAPPIAGLASSSSAEASPQWSTTLALSWVLPVQPVNGELVFNADYYWQ